MNRLVSIIVFTKNRPLQLEGYLGSLFKHFPEELFQTYIIYKPELFEGEYEQCFRKYSNCIVIKENEFHRDLLRLLSQVNTKYILFGVDDVVFCDTVNFDVIEVCFAQFPDDIFGFSLRHCIEIVKNSDDVHEFNLCGQTVYRFNWKDGKSNLTSYPFDLCATVYPTEAVRKIVSNVMNHNLIIRKIFSPGSLLIKGLRGTRFARKILKSFGYFFSPNTLESWLCRWCQNNSEKIPNFLYFQKLCASVVQVNMVNTTTINTFDGTDEQTVEALNIKYKQGYRVDIDYISDNKPASLSCGREYFRLTKRE